MAQLGERAEAIRNRQVLPEEDNMLKVCGDGRKAALDLRLLGLPMTDPGKIETAAERITDLWHAHCDDTYPGPDGRESPIRGSLQLAFCDIGTPGDDWNVYDELRDQLVARGLPPELIRFVHDAKSDRDKGELFAGPSEDPNHLAPLAMWTEHVERDALGGQSHVRRPILPK